MKIFIFLLLLFTTHVEARDYFVATNGKDRNDGSIKRPFASLAKLVAVAQPGDSCYIRGGVYRETLELGAGGSEGAPITFQAYGNESVILFGADPLPTRLPWAKWKDGIWACNVNDELHSQLTRNDAMLFVGDQPLIEARWPNCKLEENWKETRKWASKNHELSTYGELVSWDVAESGLDFTGGVLHQKYVANFFASRRILSHGKGEDRIFYEKIGGFGDPDSETAEKGTGGFSDWFYITGTLSALDAEGEWFYDPSIKKLYLKPPANQHPRKLALGVKARAVGISGKNTEWVDLKNISVLGCSLRLGSMPPISGRGGQLCRNLNLSGIKVHWAAHSRYFHIPDGASTRTMHYSGRDELYPILIGENCLIDTCEFGHSPYHGLYVQGRGMRIRNCVVHNTSLNGRMNMSGLAVLYGYQSAYKSSASNTVTETTIYNSGGAGLYLLGPGAQIAERNHVFNGGLYSGDISGIYIPYAAKSLNSAIAYNWVHSIRGIGMRCDAMGRKIKVNNNVVWNTYSGCKWESAGGAEDTFTIYNNTIFVEDAMHPILLSETKPEGDLLNRRDLITENWTVLNNVSYGLKYRYWFTFWKEVKSAGLPTAYFFNQDESDRFQANYSLAGEDANRYFISTDLENIDLRPCSGSPLIGNGIAVEGVDPSACADIGAYQSGAAYWYPGADWMPGGESPPKTMKEAVALAWETLGDRRTFLTKNRGKH
ncbi:MAG: right-handed parallel beta-helix repeat-containing protein [Coraliomargarita sp. TMED73]|nr:MAG: right-handed parallel beta-helix repeat-containing protein [Coraliomargarita sp. TMED73]|tara:strand:+ start:151 stop:2289 length:2139 start_codon:yes stop_codon:yes gene_type:complete